MNNIIAWDYTKSVDKVSAMVSEWKAVSLKKSTLTDEIAQELYEAREHLGKRYKGKNDVTNVTSTWEGFLSDVGLQRMTVHRWLTAYDPKEHRLLTDEEYQKKEAKAKADKMRQEADTLRMVQNRINSGAVSNGWSDEAEEIYNRKLTENRERDERIKRMKIDMDEEDKRRNERARDQRMETEEIDELLGAYNVKQEKRKEFVEKIGLTGDNANHDFNDILISYLDTLPSNNMKIEACHNIIKICKGTVSRLQVEVHNEMV